MTNTGEQMTLTRRECVSLMGASALAASMSGAAAAAAPTTQSEWTDAMFNQPFVDVDEWRDSPVRHRYVHGGFKGTDTRFSFYFAPKEHYQGRFFQAILPVPGNENGAQQRYGNSNPAVTLDSYTLQFAIASGAYLVESNMGRTNMFPGDDHTITGYRASAAAAQYSRVLAAQMYGGRRPYGYAFGASGGSLRTISCIENANGVWDGVVPYVTASDMAMPNAFTVQAHALRLLRDKFPSIVDAVEPGGGGDMYAGLNEEQRAALLEVTRMGFPPSAWFAHEEIAIGYTGIFATLLDQMLKWDPQYFEDFWKVPGYLGANPPQSLVQARIQHTTTITKVIMSDEAEKAGLSLAISARQVAVVPAALQLKDRPKGELQGAAVIIKSGAASGHRVSIAGAQGDLLIVGFGEDNFAVVNGIRPGDEVQLDNSVYLASQTYHRHQVPPREYAVWDQFRGPDGKPLYPQRPALLGPRYQEYAAGSVQSGRFEGKMIMVESLMDQAAFAWQADWYRSKVKQVRGARADDHFRLWFVEHAMHGSPTTPADGTHIVSYLGVVHQALRDLSTWVEKGVTPPESTHYQVIEGQVIIPGKAATRRGVQPVVTLTVNGGVRAEIPVGQPVTFQGMIEVPPGTGQVVKAEWDFEGAGDYPVAGEIKTNASGAQATTAATHTFSKRGTYFPALRASSQRKPDNTSYARIENLGRVRVVVT